MRFVKGVAAGAVGTTLLNTVTYIDMALRGRPASSLPAEDVERVADSAGLSLGADEEQAGARKEALGALMGLVAGGLGGAVYGLARPHLRFVPKPLAAVAAGVGVMAATDASSALLGTTDPGSWGATDWLSDLVPHLAYGAGVALTFDALA
jgi:hypothetical protein